MTILRQIFKLTHYRRAWSSWKSPPDVLMMPASVAGEMTRRLLALLARPWAPLTAALVGFVLTLPALDVGLIVDDYFHRSILLGVGPVGTGTHPIFDLFSFLPSGPRRAGIFETGLFTWWADPNLTVTFLRPLSALTHVVDYALWPDTFAVQHLHSLLWQALAVFTVASFYRRLHGATAVAGLAAIFFAVDDAHAMCVGWLANRHALIALAAGILALQAHCRWRRGGGLAWAVVAVTTYAVTLLCGEAGLAAAAYIAAWQLTMDDAAWKNRMAALLPYGALIVLWRLVYEHFGYGATASGLYVDPGHHPIDFAFALAERWPTLQLAQWFRIPSDLFIFLPRVAQIGLAGLGIAACALLLRLFLPLLRMRREARFWAIGMSLALVPLCAGFPMDRLLLFSGVGACALLALFVEEMQLMPGGAGGRSTAHTIARVFVVLHGPLAALLLVARVVTLPLINAPIDAILAGSPANASAPRRTVVFVNGMEMVGYLPIIQAIATPTLATRRVALLASMFTDNLVYRERVDTLVITASGGFVRTAVEQLLRSPNAPFKIGERIERPDFTAEVRAIMPDGRAAQVAFQFHDALESPEYRWLAWSEKGSAEFHLPAVGSTISLPATGALAAGRVDHE